MRSVAERPPDRIIGTDSRFLEDIPSESTATFCGLCCALRSGSWRTAGDHYSGKLCYLLTAGTAQLRASTRLDFRRVRLESRTHHASAGSGLSAYYVSFRNVCHRHRRQYSKPMLHDLHIRRAVTVVTSNFGAYTIGQNGTGPAVVTESTSAAPFYRVMTLTAPAKPGDVVTLWGSGLGPYSGNETEPPSETGLNVNAAVYLGDQPATISCQGRSSSPGLDQINFTVPAGLSGCYAPIAVVVNGIVSNFTSMSVSPDGSTCSDPAGLPSTAINEVVSNGSLKVGFIELQKVAFSATVPILGPTNIKQDYGAAYFYDFNDHALLASRGLSSISSFNSCTILVSPTATPACRTTPR